MPLRRGGGSTTTSGVLCAIYSRRTARRSGSCFSHRSSDCQSHCCQYRSSGSISSPTGYRPSLLASSPPNRTCWSDHHVGLKSRSSGAVFGNTLLESDWHSARSLSLIHISEPTRRTPISYAVFCLKKKKNIQK